MVMRAVLCGLLGLLPGILPGVAASATLESDLEVVLQVDRLGQGHEAAQAALQRIAAVDAPRLPQILSAVDRGGPLASNWLRAAVDAIAERTLADGAQLPLDELYAYLEDRGNGARSRRLAFEWIVEIKPEVRDQLLEQMLDDTSLELRYDAVTRILEKADTASPDQQKQLLKQALAASRDIDQIEKCVTSLKEQGEEVDVVGLLGFITRWHLVGPFDNTGRSGLLKVYPPEQGVELNQEYEGREGTVAWQSHTTEDDRGIVDLNAALGKHKGAAAYAYTEIDISEGAAAQLRLGCINGHRVWLNGELVDTNDVYHAGMSVDQYISDVQLKPGRNTLLLKICQNEQEESWAQDWQFQLRITDELGGAIRGRVVDGTE